MRDAFSLDFTRAHLNHGSFGAVPRVVTERQDAVRAHVEEDPMRFFRLELEDLTTQARATAAAFLGLAADEVALVRNPTEAVATVLSGLAIQGRLRAGDAVVTSEQGYGAVALAVGHWCDRTGAAHDVAPMPVDVSDQAVVEAYRQAFHAVEDRGDVVRLVVVDQVTSPTGRVMPVAAVAALARDHGALVLVDAAHGPGHLPVEVDGADFWTGTFHKWAFAGRGSAVLWVTADERDAVPPLTTGWNHGREHPLPFDLRGTDDYSAWLSLPTALGFWHEVGGTGLAARGTALLDGAVATVGSALGDPPLPVRAPAPCMRLVQLPDGVGATKEDSDALYQALAAHGVEVQPVAYGGRGYLRLSAAVYNEPADYERLAKVLPDVLP